MGVIRCKRECEDAYDVNQTEAASVPAMVTITSSMMSALQSKKSLPLHLTFASAALMAQCCSAGSGSDCGSASSAGDASP